MTGQSLIVTNIIHENEEYTVCALFEGNRLIEASARRKAAASILGNIYVGRVRDIVMSLNAAFIEIAPGLACYYPLEELKNPVYVKKINSPKLVQGDELYVQVERESMKTKPPKVTTNLSFTGTYLVLTTGNRALGLSKKLNKEERERRRQLLEAHKPPEFGLILRTNSRNATDEQLLEELSQLLAQARTLLAKAAHMTCFACLRRQEPEYLETLLNVPQKGLTEIITDEPELYGAMQAFLKEKKSPLEQCLRLYEDGQLSLDACYGLSVKLTEALKERVWLKSGGYLVIQPTEALTVIDVNTGKSTVKRDVQEHYLKVNLEAAQEIAHQLRLRNLSGIIIVDFIDMTSMEAKKQLMEALRDYTHSDPIPVQVVDMTKLNLVELTRKKVKRSLREQLEEKKC